MSNDEVSAFLIHHSLFLVQYSSVSCHIY